MTFPLPQFFRPPSFRLTPPNDMRPVPNDQRFGLQQLLVPDVTYEDDGCNWSIDYGLYLPVVGERTSRLQVWGRRPFCTPTNFTPPPLPPPPVDLGNDKQADLGDGTNTIFCILYASRERFLLTHTRSEYIPGTYINVDREYLEYRTRTETKITNAQYPVDFGNGIIGSKISATITGITTKKYSNNPINGNLAGTTDVQTRTFFYSWDCYINSPSNGVEFAKRVSGSDRFFIRQGDIGLYVCQGSPGFILNNLLSRQIDFNRNLFAFEPVYEQITSNQAIGSDQGYDRVWERLYRIENTKPFIPPPPPRKRKPDMACCPGQENNDQYLKLLLKRVGKLPASVPDLFTKQKPSMITIESLAELILWVVQQLDALMGSYPIEIEIEDTDITQKGNQSKKISLPNQAEAIAEMVGLLSLIKTESSANLNATLRTLVEAGMAKKAATISCELGEANAEYLGYKLEEKIKKMQMTFDYTKDKTDEVLQEKEIEYVGYKNEDKKDINDVFVKLLEMSAMYKAQNFVKVGGSYDIYKKLGIDVSAIENRVKQDKDQDFDTFTERAEKGFVDIPGVTDTANPYGLPLEQRPRIREIGQDVSRGSD